MNKLAVFLLASVAAAGCLSSKSPYDYIENWLVREDAVRPFAVPVDVIYVPDRLYLEVGVLPEMLSATRDAVGRGKFHSRARVFSPLVAGADDMEKAVKWYVANCAEAGRPFVFIGEGKGGALLKAYAEANGDWLAKKGFAGGFYADRPDRDFVSPEMVDEIGRIVAEIRYRQQWGREMPEGMLGK